jgi:hypothetical protein
MLQTNDHTVVRRIYIFVVAGFFGLGLLHTALTYPLYAALSAPALWFAGTGLLLVAIAALNWIVLRMQARDSAIARVVTAVNAAGLVLALLVLRVVPEPPTYVLLVLFAIAVILPGALRRRPPLSRNHELKWNLK